MHRSSSAKFFIATILIVANTTVVLYFARDKFELPNYLANPLSFLANIFESKELIEPEENTEIGNLLEVDLAENKLKHHPQQPSLVSQKLINKVELPVLHSVCSDERPKSNNKRIYSWVDSDGIQHLSDKPRVTESNTPVTLVGTIQADAISINYSGTTPPFNLQKEIFARVSANSKLFEKIMPKELIKPVHINFRMFSDVKNYEAYQARVAPSLMNPSNGFYMSSTNESVVLMNKGDNSINTAVHEAMHSINRHWFGHMSKWLNEGIAEYAETIHLEKSVHSDWRKYLSQNGALKHGALFEADRNSWKTQSTKMYSTSWAYVAFLIETSPNTLSRYLIEENNNGCRELSVADIERISAKPLSVVQGEFNRWLQHF